MTKNTWLTLFTFFTLALCITYVLNRFLPPLKTGGVDITSILTGLGPLSGGLLCYGMFKTPNTYRIGIHGVQPAITYSLLALTIVLPLVFITRASKDLISASIVTQFLYSFCEEFGWRHYLQNLTNRTSRWVWPFITGTLWFFWHYAIVADPIRVLTGQHLPPLIGIPVSILFLSLFSFLWGDLTIKTKAILIPSIAHAITKYADPVSLCIVVTLLVLLQ